MTVLTTELIRKKAEHHSGLLFDLEELSLHQLKIESLNKCIARTCPKLKILYLQNNLIPKIEFLSRLKDLRYLNMALNNLTAITGLSSCEKLTKLDLTVNFIDIDTFYDSIVGLKENTFLNELYLTGNPCTSHPNYRSFVISTLPSLTKLDGTDITKAERIAAENEREEVVKAVMEAAAAKRAEKAAATPVGEIKGTDPHAYTPESRTSMYREQDEAEKKTAAERASSLSGPADPMKEAQKKLNERAHESEDGKLPTQRNTGRYDFTVKSDDPSVITVEIEVPRFLDTSLIDIQIHPRWFQAIIKGKSLLLHLEDEISVTQSRVERHPITGYVKLIMPRIITKTETIYVTNNKHEDEEEANKENDRSITTTATATATSMPSSIRVDAEIKGKKQPTSTSTAPRAIVNDSIKEVSATRSAALEQEHQKQQQLRQQQQQQATTITSTGRIVHRQPKPIPADFVDDADVPPLE